MARYAKLMVVFLALIVVGGFTPSLAQSTPAVPATPTASAPVFQVTLPGVKNRIFAADQVGASGCTGNNISPEIDWANAPDGTQGFAVSMYDMDAPTGSGLWHWYVFNIPASTMSLPAGAGDPTKNLLPAGAVNGLNDLGVTGYSGPCPPPGDRPHRYLITVFALKTATLPVNQIVSGARLGTNANSNMIAKATTIIIYGRPSTLQVTSPAVTDGGTFATAQIGNTGTCKGGNMSPEIDWANAPAGTKSFAVSMYDMDAPTGSGLWHWVVFNIPATATSLPADAGDPTKNLLPTGALMGRNDAGDNAYRGPCPPAGDPPHRYLITVFALGADKLPLDKKASGALIGFYLNSATLARTTIVALYAS